MRPETRKRSPPDRGPRLTDRRMARMAQPIAMTFDFDRSQKAVFDHFWRHDTLDGLRWFLMIDPTSHGWPLADPAGRLLLTPDGKQILRARWWRCQFGDELPAEAVYGVRFKVSFTLEVLTW